MSADRHAGLRTCVGCRTRDERSALLRVVALAGSDAQPGVALLVPDERGRLPGRGAWLHPELGCLELAVTRRAFPRALRTTGAVDPGRLREWIAAR